MKVLKTKKFNKYKNWSKKISMIFLLFSITQVSFSGSPGTYREQIYEVIPQIKEILKENNYKCIECFFVEPLSNGFAFNFYKIKSKKIIGRLTKLLINKYYEEDGKIYVHGTFYKTKHENTNRGIFGFFQDEPGMELILYKQGE